MSEALAHVALLGMTELQKADLLRLHAQFADTEHLGTRHLIDKAVRAGFVTKVAPNYWEFNELGESVIAALKAATPTPNR